MKSFTKVVAKRKSLGIMKQIEGKLPLSLDAYKLLCNKALNCNNTHIHLYLVSQWNLMVRTSSVQCLNYQFIGWSSDSLTIKVPFSKSDQLGERAFAKHCYANPVTPQICLILSLGIHLLCTSLHSNSDFRIFPQESIAFTFSNWLKETADHLTDNEKLILGISPDELGTHSIRKGSCTYASGQESSPSSTSIKLRMDHSLGETYDRYYHESDGSDRLLGRFVSGLCFTSNEFSTLPPHIVSRDILANINWNDIVPYYDRYPAPFKTSIPFLVASVTYHLDFLNTVLLPTHPLYQTPFYTNKCYELFKNEIFTGFGKCSKTELQATGIPANHVIREGLDRLYNLCQDHFSSIDNQLSVELPKNVKDMLLQNFNIEGAIAVSRNDLFECINRLENRLLSANITNTLSTTSSTTSSSSTSNTNFDLFCWNGKYHTIPQDFKLPNGNVKTLWNLYHFGDKQKRISPYKTIIPMYDFESRKEKQKFSELSLVMKEVDKQIESLEDNSLNINDVLKLDITTRDNIFANAYEKINFGDNNKKRLSDISYATANKKLKQVKKNININTGND